MTHKLIASSSEVVFCCKTRNVARHLFEVYPQREMHASRENRLAKVPVWLCARAVTALTDNRAHKARRRA